MMDIYKLNLGIRLAILAASLTLTALALAHLVVFAGRSNSVDGA
ncbi:hypothetical protein [Acidianus ambivalens]|nr:hypothetical protein [Acidianus ambivalens]